MTRHSNKLPFLCTLFLAGAMTALPSLTATVRADDHHADDHPFAEAHFAMDSLAAARKFISKEDYKSAHDSLTDARKHLNLADKSDHRKAALDQIDNAIDACEHKRPAICSDHIDKATVEIQAAMK